MITERDWSRAEDPDRRIGRRIEHHPSIGSTNDRARLLLAQGGPDGLAVVADEQTDGRGRRGRSWLSPPGKNLMVSIGLHPRIEPARAGLLGIAAAVATHDACAATVPGARLGIRWPNDIVTADGLKLAGLLVETSVVGGALGDAVIGVGVNVNWRRADMPGEIASRATSLADLAGEDLDRVELLQQLLRHLGDGLEALEGGGSPLPRYRSLSALDGREVRVEVGETSVEGVVAGAADDGGLLLDTEAGRLSLSVGEVVAVRDLVRGGAA